MNLSKEIALAKLQQYCAYQDRCHSEVRTKLLSLKIYGEDLEEIISLLIQDKFLDELRYAKSYARGKFRIKRWGRHKIKQHLILKQVSEYCIRKALDEIDEEEYKEVLTSIIEKKSKTCGGLNDDICRFKVMRYCQSRGFEISLIQSILFG